jgi:hypothetical protein
MWLQNSCFEWICHNINKHLYIYTHTHTHTHSLSLCLVISRLHGLLVGNYINWGHRNSQWIVAMMVLRFSHHLLTVVFPSALVGLHQPTQSSCCLRLITLKFIVLWIIWYWMNEILLYHQPSKSVVHLFTNRFCCCYTNDLQQTWSYFEIL